jgi:hypothetical protein
MNIIIYIGLIIIGMVIIVFLGLKFANYLRKLLIKGE